MKFLRLLHANKEIEPKVFDAVYEKEIEKKIRLRYSASAEFAILRQKDTKVDEFNAYNEYAEQCKAEVKAELGIV